MLTGSWQIKGSHNRRNITGLQINNADYYLLRRNSWGQEEIADRGRCKITSGMIFLFPDNGGPQKGPELRDGKSILIYDDSGTLEFVKR